MGNNMKKSLICNGNTWQLHLTKPLAQLLALSESEHTVNLVIKNKTLYVKRILTKDLEQYKDLLCKKLIKRGAGYGLNIPISVLELLGINPETDMLECEIDDQLLIIKKAE